MSYCNFDKAWTHVERTTPDGQITISLMVAVDGQYDPGYPAPPCSNPDSPLYSDPGSPSDIEINDIVEVEDIVVECCEDDLREDDRALLKAADEAPNERVTNYLLELFACRHGLGPWSAIEFTAEEVRQLEEAAEQDLVEQRDSALAGKAEADAEARWERRNDRDGCY